MVEPLSFEQNRTAGLIMDYQNRQEFSEKIVHVAWSV